MPLGLAYIAAALEKVGERVVVVDAVGEAPVQFTAYFKGFLVGLRLEEIVERIPADAEAIGITAIFTHEWPIVVRLVDLIKRARPETPVILGGEHITSMPEFSLLTSRADYAVLGEGEETVVELLDVLAGRRHPSQVDGLCYREGGAITVNKRRTRRADIDDIAWPAWHHIKVDVYNAHRYTGSMFAGTTTIPILATRGCPYQCTYCSAPNMWTPKWVPRDPKKVVDEIQHLVETYGARNFPFQDLTAIIRKEWIVEFCNEIIARKLDIMWQLASGTRSEAIDDEVADLLARTKMTSMAYAPESGSDSTRRMIKKKIRADRLFESMDAAARHNLNVSVFLIVGLPHDTRDNLAENIPFIDEIKTHGVTDLSIGYYMALPGTELFHTLYDSGKVVLDKAYFKHILDSLALYPTRRYCDGVSQLQLTYWKFRLLLRFYATGRSDEKGRLLKSVGRALSGLFNSEGHASKLPTAARLAIVNLLTGMRVRMRRRWMPKAEEDAMFIGWDQIYRTVRQQKLKDGIVKAALEDTRELYKSNVIPAIERDHMSPRTVQIGTQ